MKIALSVLILSALIVSGHAQTWTPLSVGNSADVIDLAFPSDDTGFAALSNGTIRETVNGGLNWSVIPSPNYFTGNLEFISGARGFILCDSGIVSTSNTGVTWTVAYDNPNVQWWDIFFVNTSVGFAAGTSNQYDSFYVYKTLDAGVTWAPCTPIHDWNAQTPFLHFRTPLEGYISGSDSVYRTTNGGLTWTSVFANPNGAAITTICTPDANTAYMCDGYNLDVVKSVNGGVTWNSTSQIMGSPAWASHFINPSFGFMFGGNGFSAGYIAETTNGGASWNNVYTGGVTLGCKDFPSNVTGYCGGTGGVIMKYSDPMSITFTPTSSVNIYPNPARDFITIENVEIGSVITITNSLGQLVKTELAVNNWMRIDVTNLAEGVYICNVASQLKNCSTKIAVSH